MKRNQKIEQNVCSDDDVPKSDKQNNISSNNGLIYKVNDSPPWYLCLLFGFQHYITMLGGTVTYPLILIPKLCIREEDTARSHIIATTIFVSGLATIIQTTLGIRLPIVQGSSFAFLLPVLTILSLPQWQCPSDEQIINSRSATFDGEYGGNVTDNEYTKVWQIRMRELSGAIIIGSLFEVLIGFTGIVGIMIKWITPLAIAPTVALIGLNLFQLAAKDAGQSWIVSGLTIVFMIIFSQYMAKTAIPFPVCNKKKGMRYKRLQIFGLFPVLLTIAIVWIICGVLTSTGIFPPDHAGRTDKGIKLLKDSPWFYFPFPFQWGLPTITLSAVLAMIAGIMASVIESIGDYYACATLSEAPPPPTHAMNRGICMEGIGCVLAGIFGSGCGVTSYSQNVGAIGITKVGSRRVVQYAALIIMAASCLLKFSTLFSAIPQPIIGGIFCSVFGLIISVGISNLQYVDLNSPRNLFVLGFSLFMGLVIPQYLADNKGVIKTGSETLDQIITVLLSTGMFVGGFLGFILDNTIPGTDEERGIKKWSQLKDVEKEESLDEVDGKSGSQNQKSCYDLPFIKNYSIMKYIPICPSYNEQVFVNILQKRKIASYELRKGPENKNDSIDKITSV